MTAAATQVPTLVIHDWSSRCSACSHRANPQEPEHKSAGHRRAGCGVTYQAVALAADANQLSWAGARDIAAALELPLVGRWPS